MGIIDFSFSSFVAKSRMLCGGAGRSFAVRCVGLFRVCCRSPMMIMLGFLCCLLVACMAFSMFCLSVYGGLMCCFVSCFWFFGCCLVVCLLLPAPFLFILLQQ